MTNPKMKGKMPIQDDVSHQPTPDEFARKRIFFERLTGMVVSLQKMRRLHGYVTMEATTSALDGCEQCRLVVKQSGRIKVIIKEPHLGLHLEPTDGDAVMFVWDGAMFVARMTDH